MFDCAHTLAYD